MFDTIRLTEQVLRGNLVAKKGDPVKNIFHLKKGAIEVLKVTPGMETLTPDDPQEKSVPIQVIEAGQTFLEMEALVGEPSPFFFRAASMCTIARLSMDEEELKAFLFPHFDLTLQLVQNLALTCQALLKKGAHCQMALDRLNRAFRGYCEDFFHLVVQNIAQAPRPPEAANWVQTVARNASQNPLFALGHRFFSERNPETWKDGYASVSSSAISEAVGNTRVFQAGQFLFREGDPGDSMFVLLQGEIEGIINNEVNFVVSEPGSMVGEISLLASLNRKEKARRSAGIRCRRESRFVVISTYDFIPFVKSKPEFLQNMIFTLRGRYLAAQKTFGAGQEKLNSLLFQLIPQAQEAFRKLGEEIRGNVGRGDLLEESLQLALRFQEKIAGETKIFRKLYIT